MQDPRHLLKKVKKNSVKSNHNFQHLQGVPAGLEYSQKCFRAKQAPFTKKNMCFAPKNCFLSIFCELQNWKSVIDPIFSWSDLFSKLEKIRTFILQLSKKCSNSNFLRAKYNFFFVNVACLARKHF